MFKVLDLRCGEFIHKADIYWNPEDAVYESRQAALQVISDMVRIRNDWSPYDWNPYDDCKALIPEYFEVIEV